MYSIFLQNYIFFVDLYHGNQIIYFEGSLGAAVKLLPYDHEVTSSSPGNSLLQKCMERLRTIDPKWSDLSPDPVKAGATCTGLPLKKIK